MDGIWIRSQNKKTLVFAHDLSIVPKPNGEGRYEIHYFPGFTFDGEWASSSLGVYSSEARALEVLGELQRHIQEQEFQRLMIAAGGYADSERDLISNADFVSRVYEMPAE